MESITAINDGTGDGAVHHAHSHHEERAHHHEEAEEEEDVAGGEHDERGSEQHSQHHAHQGSDENEGHHHDGGEVSEAAHEDGAHAHEGGHVVAEGAHEAGHDGVALHDSQHSHQHQHQQVQDVQHHHHVQHHQHHDPDAAAVNWGPPYIQLTVKIADHQVNGAYRYKAWSHYRDVVLQRLAGWQLIASGPDFATFDVPQALVAQAATERQAKIPKEDRRFWGDKSDFCRCLETILNEQEPPYRMAPMPSSYVLFCQEKRQEHKEAGNTSTLDVRTLGAMWREISDEERKPYNDRAEHLKSHGHGFQASKRRRTSSTPAAGAPASSAPVIPPTVTDCCAQNGLDPTDVLVRLLEGKQPRELISFERRLRVIMNKLHEKQFIMAQHIKDWDRLDPRLGALSGVKRSKKMVGETQHTPRMMMP